MVFLKNMKKIVIDPKSIVYIVGELENYNLTKTDKDVVGAAFEIFAEKQFAGEKGEFLLLDQLLRCV